MVNEKEAEVKKTEEEVNKSEARVMWSVAVNNSFKVGPLVFSL